MRIAIYEPVHLDWIIPLCNILSEQKNEVSFFTSIEFKNELQEVLNMQYEEFCWTYFDIQSGWNSHYKQLRKFVISKDFDLLILNSLESRHLIVYLSILSSNKRLLINVHDIHSFFLPALTLRPKKMIREIAKKMLRRKAHGFIVNAAGMKKYIESEKLTSKNVFWIPPVITRAEKPACTRLNSISMLIAGSIDKKRRDYIFALEIFEEIGNYNRDSLELILAGRPVGIYGQLILERASVLKKQGYRISFYEEEIPEIQFQELVSSADIIFSPIVVHTYMDGIMEIYGLSKCSGNIYDAIRHGKNLLIPSSLSVPFEIEPGCLKYNSKRHLLEIIDKLIKEPESLTVYKWKAYESSLKYSASLLMEKFEAMIMDGRYL